MLAVVGACSDTDDRDADSGVAGPTTAAATSAIPGDPSIASTAPEAAPDRCAEHPTRSRTDVTASGNRWFAETIDLTVERSDVELGEAPAWVLPLGDGSWFVSLEGGGAVEVDPSGEITAAEPVAGPGPPVVDADGRVVSSSVELALFDDPLPDGRVVYSGPLAAALVAPTGRYPHAVLGDDIEAGAVEVLDRCTGERTRIVVGAPDVIEGVSPMLVDLDEDGTVEVLVTTANDDVGARLTAYRLDGSLLATSDPIGQGRRWRNQLGVAPLGPGGELEIVDVQTPHLGGILRFSRVEGDQLVLRARISELTTHVIGSRNLDLGILADVTGDERPEVLVYRQDRFRLVAIERTADGAEVVAEVELTGRGVTNLAVQEAGGGALALGTADGVLHVWRPLAEG